MLSVENSQQQKIGIFYKNFPLHMEVLRDMWKYLEVLGSTWKYTEVSGNEVEVQYKVVVLRKYVKVSGSGVHIFLRPG